MVNIKVLKILNLVTYVLMATIFVGTYYSYDNFLNITGFIHVVQKNETVLTPDYYVFDISFIIFACFFLSILFQFRQTCLYRESIENITNGVDKYVKRVNFYFMVSGFLYIGWLINFLIYSEVSMILSTICILGSIYFGFLIDYVAKPFSLERNCYEIVLGSIPLSIFLGWNIILFFLTFTRAAISQNEFSMDSKYIFCVLVLVFITICLTVYLMNYGNYILMLVNLYYVVNMFIKYNGVNDMVKYGIIIDICIIIFILIIKIIIDINRYKIFREEKELNENLI